MHNYQNFRGVRDGELTPLSRYWQKMDKLIGAQDAMFEITRMARENPDVDMEEDVKQSVEIYNIFLRRTRELEIIISN